MERTRYRLLTEALLDEIEGQDRAGQEEWLFLSESDEFRGRWEVAALWPDWFFDFEPLVGHYRTVSPAKLDEFLTFAEDGGYQVVFEDPPEGILASFDSLRDPPPFILNSALENTVHGMFPWQIEGFNKLVKDEDLGAGLVIWDTGTGKTAFIAAALKWHEEHGHPYDLALAVVKKNNKIDTQRKLRMLAGLDSFVIEGKPSKRDKVYSEITERFEAGDKATVITNYESFLNDDEMFKWLVEDRDCLFFWDEMPTRLSSRESKRYEAVQKTLWKTFQTRTKPPEPRPSWLRQWELTATPIENSPEGLFNCVAGDTEVLPLGRYEKVYRMPYRGPLVQIITASGTKLSVTPNHAVFTPDGWIAASLLRKGDNVFRRPLQRPVGRIENLDNAPTQIHDLFQSLRTTGARESVKRAMSPDFHGDGRFGKGDIDVVDADSLLRNGLPLNVKQIRQTDLISALTDGESALASTSSLFQSLSRTSQSESGLLTRLQESWQLHFPVQTAFDPRFFQTIVNGPFADIQLLRNDATRQFLINVKPDQFVNIDIDPFGSRPTKNHVALQTAFDGVISYSDIISNFYHGLSAFVTTDEIIDIQLIEDWVGHVFDLSTSSCVYYANGLVVNNCVRLMDPKLLGTTTQFDASYVTNRNPISHKPERWGRLDKLAGTIEFMTHRASMEDPEIAKMFPEIMEDPILIDWDPRDRAIYDMLATNAVKILEEESEKEEFNVLALIQVMQMLCDAPSMIGKSAENHVEFKKVVAELGEDEDMPRMVKGSEIALRLVETLKRKPTDDRHTKFETLREILTEKHPNDKALVYMTWASYGFVPVCRQLDDWGVTYVAYTGTDKQRQTAKDRFRTDPDIQVFLSSDKGSDSIDLPEAAVGVNYNLPWTWTRKRQRQGRNNRVDSQLETTWWYTLTMHNSVDERKAEIIEQKRGYHEALFDGKAAEDAAASKLSREDLMFILTGERHTI